MSAGAAADHAAADRAPTAAADHAAADRAPTAAADHAAADRASTAAADHAQTTESACSCPCCHLVNWSEHDVLNIMSIGVSMLMRCGGMSMVTSWLSLQRKLCMCKHL
eukprot:365287-Chlamydomonas_euryale.AAC.5